jgi:hypothetical protein
MVKKPLTGEVIPPDRNGDDSEQSQGGHPPHAPTQKLRDTVESLAGGGLPQRDIATLIGISPPTLRRHYAQELLIGSAKAKAKLSQTAWSMAFGMPAEYDAAGRLIRAEVPRDRVMVMFLCKTQLNWTERYHIDVGSEQFQSVDGMSNAERRQEIESLLKVAQDRKRLQSPKPPAKGNGSDQIH